MRLVCPNCDAQYEVADSAIPETGRDVQCSNCGHAWFQMPPQHEAEAAQEAALFGDDIAAEAAAAAQPALTAPPVPPAAFPEEDDDPGTADTPPAAPATAGLAPDAAPAEQADPADVTSTAADAPPPPSRALDESLLAVLREEAEREMQARRAEAARPLETQPGLGIEEAAAASALSPAQRRLAMLKGKDPDAPPPPPAKPAARRDLLPDVEEINSTLRPSTDTRDEDAAVERLPDLTKPAAGFRSGFVLMTGLAVLMVVVYVAAPRLAEHFPALNGPLTSYVAMVDALRLWLDGLMAAATTALGGTTS